MERKPLLFDKEEGRKRKCRMRPTGRSTLQELLSNGLFFLWEAEGEALCYEWRVEKVWKRYFFKQATRLYQHPVHSSPKSESQNFPPSQHTDEWKYKMLMEVHSNRVKMKDGADPEGRTVGQHGGTQWKLEPVNF